MPINFPSDPELDELYQYAGRVWKWNGTAWESVSSAFGPIGPQGLSAYQVAVANGFVGTEEEWLDAQLNLVNGVRITVSQTEPSNPDLGDLWFW